MITAIGSRDGKPVIVCAITRENVDRLVAGSPILVPAERLQRMGFEHELDIVITFGEDQATLVGQLEGALEQAGKSS